MTLILNAKKSKLDGIICKEQIDTEILSKLLSSDLLRENFHNPFCEYSNSNELDQLTKYETLIDDKGFAHVKYNKMKNMDYGRVFPEASLGLFSIRREIRHTLAKQNYVDIDIENCHPVILLQICEKNKIDCKYLRKYVTDRQKYLEIIQTGYLKHIEDKNELKDKSKNLFIRMMYLGEVKNWFEDNDIKYKDNKKNFTINKFIMKFQDELKMIAQKINDANPDLVKLVMKRKKKQNKALYNLQGSVMSYFLQEYENQILECMFDYCIKHKYIENNVCVLCADGFMILQSKFDNKLLKNLEEHVLNKLKFVVKITNKDMSQDYLKILDDHIVNESQKSQSYRSVKNQFQKYSFRINNPITFGTMDETQGLIIRNKSDFMTRYQNVRYDDGHKKDLPFIKKWLDDPIIREYDQIDFMPMQEAPANIFNTFFGYEANKIKKTKSINVRSTKIYEHLRNLCNNERSVTTYVENFLARKLQQPYRLTNTALLFKSTEGCGKDTFFNWFGTKIMGNKYFLNTEKIETIFGKFNTGIHNKILIILNELNGKETKEVESAIKNALTCDKNLIQYKGMTPFENVNNVGYIFLTNQKNSLKISVEDRRFCAIQCNNKIANDAKYFKKIRKEMEDPQIIRAFYDYFISLDVADYDFTNDRPRTEYYNDMKENNIPVIVRFFESLLFTNDLSKNRSFGATILFKQFQNFIQNGNYKYDISSTKFGLEIKEYQGIYKKKTVYGIIYTFHFNELKDFLISEKYITWNDNENDNENDDENLSVG